jgi:hypothetical protein
MTKKREAKDESPEVAQAQEQIAAIKTEIAQAMIRRNTLPKSASDAEKAAAAALVEQLQARQHDAVQHLLAIKREETTRLEREHKEKKLRHKRLKASRQPGAHAAPHEDAVSPPPRTSARPPVDRAAEAAHMDAANEEDLSFFERQQLEEEGMYGADDLAHQQVLARKRRKKEEAAARREAEREKKKEEEAKAEAAHLKEEKEARARIRQQAALKRAEEAKAEKHRQRAEREARLRAAQDARSWGWLGELLRRLKSLFGGPP